MNDPQESSVSNLEHLYSIVVGVSLALAIQSLIQVQSNSSIHVNWILLPVLAAFLLTLIPFYHGALRHLDDHYVHGKTTASHPGLALLLDFLVLFFESCLFLGLAVLLASPAYFSWAFLALLMLDSLWIVVASLASGPTSMPQAPERTWALINFVTVLVGTGALTILRAVSSPNKTPTIAYLVFILLIATLRTAVDYTLTWDYYFPDRDSDLNDSPHTSAAAATQPRPVTQ